MKTQTVVERLNNRLFGPSGESNQWSSFIYETSGFWELIKFIEPSTGSEVILYNSEHNSRLYNTSTDSYESLEKCVLRTFDEYVQNLKDITNFINNREG